MKIIFIYLPLIFFYFASPPVVPACCPWACPCPGCGSCPPFIIIISIKIAIRYQYLLRNDLGFSSSFFFLIVSSAPSSSSEKNGPSTFFTWFNSIFVKIFFLFLLFLTISSSSSKSSSLKSSSKSSSAIYLNDIILLFSIGVKAFIINLSWKFEEAKSHGFTDV